MYSTSDLKRGLLVEIDGAPHIVETTQASSPSARGATTIHKVRLRNLKTGQRIDKSFRGGDMLSPADVDRRPIQFLYADPDQHHFMDTETFEQFGFDNADIEWERNFLIEGIEGVRALYFNEQPIGLEMPNQITLEIIETPPKVKGNSATGRTKQAVLETGYAVQIPEHIDQNVRVVIDTRTGDFLSRAKD